MLARGSTNPLTRVPPRALTLSPFIDGTHTASLYRARVPNILSRRLRQPIPSWPYRLHGAPAPPAHPTQPWLGLTVNVSPYSAAALVAGLFEADRREDLPGRFAVGNAQHTNERSRDCQIGMHSRCAVLGWHHLCVERHIAEPKWRLRCAEDLVSRRSGGTRGAMPMGWWESLCGELAHHIREECRTSREL